MTTRDRLIPMSYFDDLADARKSLRENALVALETQLDLVSWLGSTGALEGYQNFMQFYGYKKLAQEAERQYYGKILRDTVKTTVENAQTFFVSKDMTEMVKMASDALAEQEFMDEGLSPTDLPSQAGFVVFDHPIVIGEAATDPDPERRELVGIPLAGFAWRHSMVGTRPGVPGTAPVESVRPNETVPGIEYFLFLSPEGAQSMLPEDGVLDKELSGPWVIYDFSGWRYGVGWAIAGDKPVEGHHDDEGRLLVAPVVAATRRVLLTVFKMLGEKITALESEHPYRALKRRSQGILPQAGDVVVVRLRKEYHPREKFAADHGEDDVQEPWYTHRFLVRGHWKRQFYGKGRAQRKIIWVAPFIKGPEDRPLVIKDRVYALEQ